jgi:hypothetical protein
MRSEKTLYLLGLPIRGLETERGRANMPYARPEIIVMANTLAVIQGSKYHGQLLECVSDVYRCSPGAYEADE